MKKISKKKLIAISRWAALIILAVCFFIGTASYNKYIHDDNFVKWASPDATANYIFTKLYSETGEISLFEKYNLYFSDLLHPRSIRSDNGMLKPVSFLGIIIIYGKIASVFGYKIIPYLTPLFASAAIIFYHLLIKEIFGKRNAFISTFLMFCFPPLIYFSARSMFHNVLFVSLLIFGIYFGVIMTKKRKGWKKYLSLLFAAFSGAGIGLAIITRTSELLWLGPVLLILWIFNLRKIGIIKLVIFICSMSLAVMPVIYWNQILYASPFSGGYPEMNKAIFDISKASSDLVKTTVHGQTSYIGELLNKIKDSIFHFGFNGKQSLKMFFYYFVEMFSFLFFTSLLGVILFLQRIYKWEKKHFVYFLALITLSSILVLYYGSWEFYDNPDKASHTIGNSYTRYWLPMYLGLIPFTSYFLIKITRAIFPKKGSKKKEEKEEVGDNVFYKLGKSKFSTYLTKKHFGPPKRKMLINSLRVLIVATVVYFSISFVLYGSEEGLIYSAIKNEATKEEWVKVMDLTETNAVIITQYHDKLFFPDRKVVVGLFNDDRMNQQYSKMVDFMPVYYYNFTFPQKDFDYLNNSKLKSVDLQIEKVEKIDSSFTLYRLNRLEEEKEEEE